DCSYDDIKLTPEEREYYDKQTQLEEEQRQLMEQQQAEQAQPYEPYVEPQPQEDPIAEAADAFAIEEPEPQVQPETQPEPVEVVDEKVVEETAFIEEILQKVTPEQRTLFIDIIQNSQKALSELLERNFEEANIINTQIVINLEKLLGSDNITNEANNLLKTILILSTEFHAAVDHAEKGEEAALQRAVEKASRIWLNDIGEKW
ncbi:MAG: hypothetical protein ACTSP5_12390, partial [Candidatus Heimdallarchaeota archaeon]